MLSMASVRRSRHHPSLSRASTVRVQHALDPGLHRVLVWQKWHSEDTRLLKAGKDYVVGVADVVPAEERGARQHFAHRGERVRQQRLTLFDTVGHLFKRAISEPRLAGGTKVLTISLM